MKTLQDYILESIENDKLNEGKIWDALKKWWNNLFEPSTKKYDKYAGKMDNIAQHDYEQKINDSFDIKNISMRQIDPASLDKIVKPNGEEPNKLDNTGFWKFVDEQIKTNNPDIKIYGFIYEDSDIKDTCALIKVNTTKDNIIDDYIEIKNLQIINYYNKVFPLTKLIDNIKHNMVKFFDKSSGLFIKKTTDKDLYEKLVNDCDFVKETINGNINIAKLDIKK